ncbi:hypothetical protein LIA77_01130 [Sarocladium implicatum]|nr:hypothetical protein LIA77_01130 [Sarocladium implicatum]
MHPAAHPPIPALHHRLGHTQSQTAGCILAVLGHCTSLQWNLLVSFLPRDITTRSTAREQLISLVSDVTAWVRFNSRRDPCRECADSVFRQETFESTPRRGKPSIAFWLRSFATINQHTGHCSHPLGSRSTELPVRHVSICLRALSKRA